jgi:hypothetical protein
MTNIVPVPAKRIAMRFFASRLLLDDEPRIFTTRTGNVLTMQATQPRLRLRTAIEECSRFVEPPSSRRASEITTVRYVQAFVYPRPKGVTGTCYGVAAAASNTRSGHKGYWQNAFVDYIDVESEELALDIVTRYFRAPKGPFDIFEGWKEHYFEVRKIPDPETA